MAAKLKTAKNEASVDDFLVTVEDEEKRRDCFAVLKLLKEVTGEEPVMWGGSMVGFGSYHYTYASGRQGEWFQIGFSPRKQNLTLYIMAGFSKYASLMAKLGKFKTGKSCLYIKKLEDIDMGTLRELVQESVSYIALKYGAR